MGGTCSEDIEYIWILHLSLTLGPFVTWWDFGTQRGDIRKDARRSLSISAPNFKCQIYSNLLSNNVAATNKTCFRRFHLLFLPPTRETSWESAVESVGLMTTLGRTHPFLDHLQHLLIGGTGRHMAAWKNRACSNPLSRAKTIHFYICLQALLSWTNFLNDFLNTKDIEHSILEHQGLKGPSNGSNLNMIEQHDQLQRKAHHVWFGWQMFPTHVCCTWLRCCTVMRKLIRTRWFTTYTVIHNLQESVTKKKDGNTHSHWKVFTRIHV